MSHWSFAQNRYFGVRSAEWVPNKSFTRKYFAIHLAKLRSNWSFIQNPCFATHLARLIPNRSFAQNLYIGARLVKWNNKKGFESFPDAISTISTG